MSFGRHLLRQGALSPAQLNEYTHVMVVFGGRLGTVLVEAGEFTTEEIEGHLAAYLGVPRAPRDRVEHPQPEALAAISPDLAQRHAVLPLFLEKRALHVAMLDPGDAHNLEQLAFASGFAIQSYVIAERRLVGLVERHYGIRQDPRFSDGRLPARSSAWARPDAAPAQAGFDPAELARLEEALAHSPDRDSLVAALLDVARRLARRAALFVERGGTLRGVAAAGRVETTSLAGLDFPVESDDLLAQAAKLGSRWRDAPGSSANDALLLAALGNVVPPEAAVLPIRVAGRVVNLLYVDNESQPLADASLAALEAVCGKTSAAYERIIVEMKRIHC